MSPKRVFNFNPGPAALPLEVLQQAQAEMLDYKGYRYVRDGNQPSLQGIRSHRCRRSE